MVIAKPCRFFLEGECLVGENCSWIHCNPEEAKRIKGKGKGKVPFAPVRRGCGTPLCGTPLRPGAQGLEGPLEGPEGKGWGDGKSSLDKGLEVLFKGPCGQGWDDKEHHGKGLRKFPCGGSSSSQGFKEGGWGCKDREGWEPEADGHPYGWPQVEDEARAR